MSEPPVSTEEVAVAAGRMVWYASIWRRLGAWFLDQLILGIGLAALEWGSHLVILQLWPHRSGEYMIGVVPFYLRFILNGVVRMLYFSFMESSERGATVGKMAVNLRVLDLEGNRISFGRAVARWFASFLSYFTVGVGFVIAAFSEKRQALHDMIAGTLVVDLD